MCIVAIAWQVLEGLPLALLSNRDEFYARTATPLQHWADGVVIAGQDDASKGTWLGTTAQGRWAVITNFRDARDTASYVPSRGQIITDFLHSELSPWQFSQHLAQHQLSYAGYNLICGDRTQAVYSSNRGEAPQLLANGVYVLSNGLMSESWAKCEHLRQRFNQELLPSLHQHLATDFVKNPAQAWAALLPQVWDVLEDERQRADELLPDTGVGVQMERLLSSTFIQSPIYGTRCSNLMLMAEQKLLWWEKTQQGTLEDNVVMIEQTLG